jgi:xanthine dehydrogenase accessory factor
MTQEQSGNDHGQRGSRSPESSVRWQQEGHGVLLVTVVRTWGSSPRPEGAMLAVRDDGLVVGSVSGGCIEDDIIDRVRREGIHSTAPKR